MAKHASPMSSSPEPVTKITTAILSVSDKTGIVEFARSLSQLGVEILSTGGTRHELQQAGIEVTDVASYTEFPEMMDGRVKTLHPRIFGGILARRDVSSDRISMEQHGMRFIDLVVVNLYPFQRTIARPETTMAEAIEQIDIGGPGLVRAAAKNHGCVTVVTRPDQYAEVLDQIKQSGGTSLQKRRELATAAFQHTADYDAAIARYFAGKVSQPQAEASESFPACFQTKYDFMSLLRYGENPHQRAAVYQQRDYHGCSIVNASCLHGKELSYNNYLDLDAALHVVRSFSEPAATVIKHNNPCGIALGSTIDEALGKALAGDPESAFGSILGLNRELDEATAELLAAPGLFIEAIVAPNFHPRALQILTTRPKWKNNVRLLALPQLQPSAAEIVCRPIAGGALLQDSDCERSDHRNWRLVTQHKPADTVLAELEFAWKVVRHIRSNAIVITQQGSAVGVGAGQMSRIDAVAIAIHKAGDRARGAVLASDAFFPFPDSIQMAAQAGITAVVQPGGSKKDEDVIDACNQLGLSMYFTGQRHFKH